MIEAQRRAFIEVLSACGVAPAVFEHSGAQPRESWRQVLFGVVAPLARLAEAELARGLGAVGLGFADLRASDIQARARSYRALLGGPEQQGMDPERAAHLVGFDADE